MPFDTVSLVIEDKEIKDLLSYSMDSDLYVASSAFRFELPGNETFIRAGDKIQFRVNGLIEMTGIIDTVEESTKKSGASISASGRDLTGLLCDHCVEDFGEKYSLSGKTIKQIAETLFAQVPFIKQCRVYYSNGADRIDAVWQNNFISPGSTVFEVLKTYAAGRGLIFHSLPNGSFVFSKPCERGEIQYRLQRKKIDSAANNIIEGTGVRDISRSYSKAVILCQQQGEDEWGNPLKINAKGSATLTMGVGGDFPFYKPFVGTNNGDGISPKLEAKRFLNSSRAKMFRLEYTVPNHGQNGWNWAVNSLAHVVDECIHKNDGTTVDGDYLIYGRTFEMASKASGPTTKLRLGMPGAILND